MNLLISFLIGFVSSITVSFITGMIITWLLIKDLERKRNNDDF